MKRRVHLDLLRIVAILCVIYNHTNERGYIRYALTSSMVSRCFYIAVAALIAVAVPLFFMISGALLLPKQESIAELFQKRVSRILLVILIFSGLQYVILLVEGRAEASAEYILRKLFVKGMVPSYWYLYAYLAYLLTLPLLRKLVLVLKKQDYLYLFGMLLFAEGILPLLLYPFGVTSPNKFFVLPMLDRVVVYPLLGYYLETYVTDEAYCPKNTAKMLVGMFLVLTIFVVMTIIRDLPYEEFKTYDKGLYTCSLTMVLDVGVYYLIKRFCIKRGWLSAFATQDEPEGQKKRERIIASLGSATFGIYLLEPPIRIHTAWLCDAMAVHLGHFFACVIWVILIALIGYAITVVLKRIPGLRRLL